MDNTTATLWGEKRYYSLNYYLQNIYHEKVYRLSLDAGMSCPNRDGTLGTTGCIFCSAGGSGDFASSSALSIPMQLADAKARIHKKVSCHKYIAYFQAYTNTYAPINYLEQVYMQAVHDPEVVILSIATRPDCLNHEVLSLLSRIHALKPVWIELGLQTIHDNSRDFVRSGFSYDVFLSAVTALNELHIPVIVHLILGLPGETKQMMLESVTAIAHLPIWGVKLQLLHVLQNTELASYYQAHPFPVFSLEAYCELVIDCMELLPKQMVIHRMTGDGPRKLLIAPLWSTDKKKVLNRIHKRLLERNTYQGRLYTPDIL